MNRVMGFAAALVSVVLSAGVSPAQTAEKLYILNCRERVAGDISRWSPGVNEGKSMDFVDTCYLIRHAQGWFLWDTGISDAVAAIPNGLAPLPIRRRRPKTVDQLGIQTVRPRPWRVSHTISHNIFPPGDAILAEFGSAVEAVQCATDVKAALGTRQVRFRIGSNLGDVMLHGQRLLGDGVNVAARLQTAAEPGGICISGSVHDQICNKLSLSFQALDETNFKNIQQPVRTFSMTEAEGPGALPSPMPRGVGSRSTKWVGAGLLLLTGGGYWIYAVSERSNAEHARLIATANPQE